MSTQNQTQENVTSIINVDTNELRNALKKISSGSGSLLYKVDKYLTVYPAFQLRAPSGFIYKMQILNHTYLRPVDCSKYVSKTGLTFSYCKAKPSLSAEWKEVSGLWIVNENFRKMTMKSNRKLWRSENEVNLEYIPDWANLIFVTNYGYEAYEMARKAPTISLPVIYQDGDVEMYDFTQYVSQIIPALSYEKLIYEPRRLVGISKIRFEKPIIEIELFILQRTSLRAHLVITTEDVTAKVNGNDSEVKLRTGAYIVLHP